MGRGEGERSDGWPFCVLAPSQTQPHPDTKPHRHTQQHPQRYYETALPPSGSADAAVLDICSSWVSHYPEGYTAGRVVGLGMVAEELKANKQLTEW